jgi:hypothetical protein
MFSKKYTVSLLDSKWNIIKSNIKLLSIPRRGEYIWHINVYYSVLNVVHSTNKKQGTYIIVEQFGDKLPL